MSGTETPVVTPSNVVRQGQEGITVSVAREGGGLSGLRGVDFEDLVVSVQGNTDDRFVLGVTVPHGVKPGPRTLRFATAGGATTVADLIDVTPIAAGPGGSDSEVGTTQSPFRSLKQALAVSGPGDTVRLANGTYDRANGETWRYAPAQAVTVVGESPMTVLEGGGANGDGTSAFEPAADAVIQNVSMIAFDVAVNVLKPSRVALEGVVVQAWSGGVVLSGCDDCQLDIDATTISITGDDALALNVPQSNHRSRVSLRGAHLNGGVLVADADATVSIDGTTIDDPSATNAGVNFAGSTLDITNSAIRIRSAPYGISLHAGAMSLSAVGIEGGNYCVYQIAGKTKARKTEIKGYGSIGYYLASGDLDLGTQDEAGANVFFGPMASSGLFGIYDDSDSPVTSSNTSFDGVLPPPGVVKMGDNPSGEPGKYLVASGAMIFFRVPQ